MIPYGLPRRVRWMLTRLWVATTLTVVGWAPFANAQHSDIAVYHDLSDQITTHDSVVSGQPVQRAFTRAFDFFGHPFGNTSLPKVFIGDDPGFQMSGTNAPAGSFPLPGNSGLTLNLLPFRLPGGPSGNLFHWRGDDANLRFDSLPVGHTLTIVDAVNSEFVLSGAIEQLVGALVGVTNSQGGMHEHVTFRLDDGDGDPATDPATGFYLFAFELGMTGLLDSEPVFVALSSPEIPFAVEQQVVTWMTDQLDNFVILVDLPGDFDGDGAYTCADVDGLVATIVAGTHAPHYDLTGDNLVNRADLDEWRSAAGRLLTTSGNPVLEGDANLDGAVDGSDFGAWNGNKFTAVAAWCSGDFNADGVVDGSDFGIWNGNKFQAADGASATVPEPQSLVWIAAVWALGSMRRFFQRHNFDSCSLGDTNDFQTTSCCPSILRFARHRLHAHDWRGSIPIRPT